MSEKKKLKTEIESRHNSCEYSVFLFEDADYWDNDLINHINRFLNINQEVSLFYLGKKIFTFYFDFLFSKSCKIKYKCIRTNRFKDIWTWS